MSDMFLLGLTAEGLRYTANTKAEGQKEITSVLAIMSDPDHPIQNELTKKSNKDYNWVES